MTARAAAPALELLNVRKTFRLRNRADALRDAIPRLAQRMVGRAAPAAPPFVALDDVSFRVAPGEALGLVGANGSGKSTSLRIAAGIYPADAGTVVVRGRVSALLELAAGFHPDLSGRENVFLAGALQGLTRRAVQEIFDRIVTFADIGAFLDAPVRTYSWGMGVRLGFAVAAHVPAEVLLIDEVLAVGDAAFRARCLRRMAERRAEGAAIVFVSHNLALVERFCDRVIVLERGRALFEGAPRAALDRYRVLALGSAPTASARSAVPQLRRGTGEVRLRRVVLSVAGGGPSGTAVAGRPMSIELEWEGAQGNPEIVVGVSLHDCEGTLLAEIARAIGAERPTGQGGHVGCAIVEIPRLPLLPGSYEVSAWIRDAAGLSDLDHHQALYPLTVLGERRSGSAGSVDLEPRWHVDGERGKT